MKDPIESFIKQYIIVFPVENKGLGSERKDVGLFNSNRASFEEGYMENTVSYLLNKHLFNSHLLND